MIPVCFVEQTLVCPVCQKCVLLLQIYFSEALTALILLSVPACCLHLALDSPYCRYPSKHGGMHEKYSWECYLKFMPTNKGGSHKAPNQHYSDLTHQYSCSVFCPELHGTRQSKCCIACNDIVLSGCSALQEHIASTETHQYQAVVFWCTEGVKGYSNFQHWLKIASLLFKKRKALLIIAALCWLPKASGLSMCHFLGGAWESVDATLAAQNQNHGND